MTFNQNKIVEEAGLHNYIKWLHEGRRSYRSEQPLPQREFVTQYINREYQTWRTRMRDCAEVDGGDRE